MEPRVAWIEEQPLDGVGRLEGSFTARSEQGLQPGERTELERAADLRFDAAIAWARERAGMVLVRFGRRAEYWSAGATPHWRYPAWPPPDLPAFVDRPAPETSSLSKPPGEPVYWAVTFWLMPRDLSAAQDPSVHEGWEIAIACSATSGRLSWDATPLNNFLADKSQARADRIDSGYLTLWSPEYRVYVVEHADSVASAERQARTKYVPPAGFASRVTTRPADLDDE